MGSPRWAKLAETYEGDALIYEGAAKFSEGASLSPAFEVTVPAALTFEGLAATYGTAAHMTSAAGGVATYAGTHNYQSLLNTAINFALGKASGLKGVAAEGSGMVGGAVANAVTPNACAEKH